MKLIVGLGNPGKHYENTRHNIGFAVIDRYASLNKLSFSTKLNGQYVQTNINSEKVILLKPQLFINLSGDVLKKFVDYFKIDIKDILIINDDLDLKIGKYKLKEKGSSAGHNGLKNIEANLNTNEYKRLKIGISNNKDIDTKDYVLGHINNEDRKILDETIEIAVKIIDDFTNLDFNDLMNKYNHR